MDAYKAYDISAIPVLLTHGEEKTNQSHQDPTKHLAVQITVLWKHELYRTDLKAIS